MMKVYEKKQMADDTWNNLPDLVMLNCWRFYNIELDQSAGALVQVVLIPEYVDVGGRLDEKLR